MTPHLIYDGVNPQTVLSTHYAMDIHDITGHDTQILLPHPA